MRALSFFDLRLSRRIQLGGLLALFGAPGAAAIDIARALSGPRYQLIRGTEYDLYFEIAAVGVATFLGAMLAAVLGPAWRRRSAASFLAAVCVFPLAAAQSVAANPHGPTAYHVNWPLALTVSVVVAVVVACEHPKLARQIADARAVPRWAQQAGRPLQ